MKRRRRSSEVWVETCGAVMVMSKVNREGGSREGRERGTVANAPETETNGVPTERRPDM